jgi:hypothetical protein
LRAFDPNFLYPPPEHQPIDGRHGVAAVPFGAQMHAILQAEAHKCRKSSPRAEFS